MDAISRAHNRQRCRDDDDDDDDDDDGGHRKFITCLFDLESQWWVENLIAEIANKVTWKYSDNN